MTLTREQVIKQFKEWADAEFGPAWAGVPHHERFITCFKAFSAGRNAGLGEAVQHHIEAHGFDKHGFAAAITAPKGKQ